MARGWESKSIEAQQEEAARGRPARPALTEEQRVREERRRTLALTRARAVDDLTRASSPRYREMLERTIAALDEQLSDLER